ncbi:MAG: Holliday junction resolvase RuvX [Candidatus Neomarinimicrobiota bacterium]|nr:Holliday junction resolvase RuvX [Candidatus Neomarinimicrobiota bacterium]
MSRTLGIDFGSKRVGLALSDRLNLIASPYKTLNYISEKELISQLKSIVYENNIEIFVLGLPINMKGEDTIQTKKVRNFKKLLSGLGLPVIYEDERLSSISAKNSLVLQNIKTGHHKGAIDRTAAAIILQQYLDKSSN